MKLAAIVVGVALVAVALLLFGPRGSSHASVAPPTPPAIADSPPAAAKHEAPLGRAHLPASAAAKAKLVLDGAARAKMLDAIAAARRHDEPTPPATFSADAPGELDKDYVRDQIREILPLLAECYNHALERDPKLGGRMMVDFSIVGDPSVGGLVGDSKIDGDKSDIGDADMRECVQETMYAAKFKPPGENGTVRVSYPFVFRPSDDGDQ
jgi:hypothetical protein